MPSAREHLEPNDFVGAGKPASTRPLTHLVGVFRFQLFKPHQLLFKQVSILWIETHAPGAKHAIA